MLTKSISKLIKNFSIEVMPRTLGKLEKKQKHEKPASLLATTSTSAVPGLVLRPGPVAGCCLLQVLCASSSSPEGGTSIPGNHFLGL